jgi:hypothetical protein
MNMSALSPKGRAVIESGRRALRASAADRERIEAALRARLGTDVLSPEPASSPLTPHSAWRFVPAAATAVVVVGGVLVLGLTTRSREAAVPPAPTVAAQDAAVAVEVEVERDEATVVVPSPPVKATAPPSRPPRPVDRLGQEVALLTRATSALKAGRAAEALEALDAHGRKFPHGVLAEERHAARAQALCTMGRVREGRGELARLAPSSPAGDRARQVCDGAERKRKGAE